MRHQQYFPSRLSDQVLWLIQFRQSLPKVAAALALPAAKVAERMRDLDWLIYLCGAYQTHARVHFKASSALIGVIQYGKGKQPLSLPSAPPPAPPAGEPPPPGALRRVFQWVQIIKHSPGYSKVEGTRLGIEGNLHTVTATVPVFNVKVTRGKTGEVARLSYRRYGHACVEIQTRRGGGDWEPMGRGLYGGMRAEDARPLLVAGVPEVREYRMRFWDAMETKHEWGNISLVTISP